MTLSKRQKETRKLFRHDGKSYNFTDGRGQKWKYVWSDSFGEYIPHKVKFFKKRKRTTRSTSLFNFPKPKSIFGGFR